MGVIRAYQRFLNLPQSPEAELEGLSLDELDRLAQELEGQADAGREP